MVLFTVLWQFLPQILVCFSTKISLFLFGFSTHHQRNSNNTWHHCSFWIDTHTVLCGISSVNNDNKVSSPKCEMDWKEVKRDSTWQHLKSSIDSISPFLKLFYILLVFWLIKLKLLDIVVATKFCTNCHQWSCISHRPNVTWLTELVEWLSINIV